MLHEVLLECFQEVRLGFLGGVGVGKLLLLVRQWLLFVIGGWNVLIVVPGSCVAHGVVLVVAGIVGSGDYIRWGGEPG